MNFETIAILVCLLCGIALTYVSYEAVFSPVFSEMKLTQTFFSVFCFIGICISVITTTLLLSTLKTTTKNERGIVK